MMVTQTRWRGVDDERKNRAGWNTSSDDYQRQHGAQLADNPMGWGTWSIPESELGILGDVDGRDVLELGCGAARWSLGLASIGARPVGRDLSEQQLGHARGVMDEEDRSIPLVQASAWNLPFAEACFDIVFCDHGAMTFVDPYDAVPEVARVLRTDGVFAFNMSSPLRDLCLDLERDELTSCLQADYFAMRRQSWDDEVNFQLPYGNWVRLFRESNFVLEDLVELRPRKSATTSYVEFAQLEWARRWPAENVWKLRKSR